MAGPFDGESLTFDCPVCDGAMTVSIATLRVTEKTECLQCEAIFDASEFAETMDDVDEAWDDFLDSLDDLNDDLEI